MDAEQPREGSPNHWYRPQKSRKDLGIRIVTGNLQEYLDEDKDFKEKYNFGINGVWIASEDGKSGTYVSEDDYTEEIKEQMKLASQRNRESAQAGSIKL